MVKDPGMKCLAPGPFGLVLLALLLSGCTQAPGSQDYNAGFLSYSDQNLSFIYPDWEEHEPGPEKLVSVASGGVIVEASEMEGQNPEQMFNAMKQSFESNQEVELVSADEETLFLSFRGEYQGHVFVNSVKLARCNTGLYSFNTICLEELCPKVQDIFDAFMDSVQCIGFEEPEKRLVGFTQEDFSFTHPDWVDLPDKKENELKKLVFGQCLVLLSELDSNPISVFDSTLNALQLEPEAEIFGSSREELVLEFQAPINSVEYRAKSRMLYCNNKTYSLAALCAKGTEQEMIDFAFASLDSMACAKPYEYSQPKPLEDYSLLSFSQEDYSMAYPDWEPMADYSIQTVLGVNSGGCHLSVNKYESTLDALMAYLQQFAEENNLHILASSEDSLDLALDYNGNSFVQYNKLNYCNYNTYVASLVCLESLKEDVQVLRQQVFDSMECARAYSPSPVYLPPAPSEPETPEQPEPEEDPIVKTDAGEKYDLDLKAIVGFINGNEFFNFVLSDFETANFVVENAPDNETIDLKLSLKGGKITLLEDGLFQDPDVTLLIPFDSIINIIENIENINFLNFLSFAASIRTEPPETKTKVIQKIFEYLGRK